MTHDDAQREMSVEKYLLGELEGTERDEFEEHLFDCELCAADLQAGAEFVEGLQSGAQGAGLQLVPKQSAKGVAAGGWGERARSWAASLLTPWIAAPALAACLAVICVQAFVVQPRLHRELAEAQTPEVLSVLEIRGATRGLGRSEIKAHAGSGFLISVDIPSESRFRAYRCTLVSPNGRPVWHTYLSPNQVTDTVVIHVPVGSTQPGTNVLRIDGIPQGQGGQAVSLLQRSFDLQISQ